MIKYLKNFTHSILSFDSNLIFIYVCLSTVVFQFNNIFKLNINFFILLEVIFLIFFTIYIKIDFFSSKFKNSFYFYLFLYHSFDFKDTLYSFFFKAISRKSS
jgi:hypothetical protein